jgi:hypothetical protein
MRYRFLALCGLAISLHAQNSPVGYSDTPIIPGQKWRVHDIDRVHPKQVAPGTESSQAQAGKAPSDAIVLFDGHDLSKWDAVKNGKIAAPGWKVENGYMEVVAGAGMLLSKEKFGTAQYHVEWTSPTEIKGNSQGRGNSGFFLMDKYEIQVLDSWNNLTYADGQASAIYGQWPPLVNAARKPGEWQTYDIVFEAPQFSGDKVVRPAYVTVLHNGVLTHNHQELIGRTIHRAVGKYEAHQPEEPVSLQDHGDKVRYRNIWVRRISGYDQK